MKDIEWCCVPVIVDDGTSELFQMPAPDEDPDQQPVFRVTQSTADLVPQDFARYKPSLQRMAEDWRVEKERVCRGTENPIPLRRASRGEANESNEAC